MGKSSALIPFDGWQGMAENVRIVIVFEKINRTTELRDGDLATILPDNQRRCVRFPQVNQVGAVKRAVLVRLAGFITTKQRLTKGRSRVPA